MQFVNLLFSVVGCFLISILICNVLGDMAERKQRERKTKQKHLVNKFLINLIRK